MLTNITRFVKNGNKITKASQIKKELIKSAILFDPLVDENFYCRKLKQLDINDFQIETLFNNVGKDILSLMALIRGHQVGVIDDEFIYDILLQPTDIKWLINAVQMKIHKLLGLDKIKLICHNNPNLYKLAVKKRLNGESYDDVYDFVHINLIDLNKE